jgi:hypothetical protein
MHIVIMLGRIFLEKICQCCSPKDWIIQGARVCFGPAGNDNKPSLCRTNLAKLDLQLKDDSFLAIQVEKVLNTYQT